MNITAWGIVQARHVHTAFTGEGARLFPGRWNQRGTPMVYTAGSLSLAAMEMLVHFDAAETLNLYTSIPINFDESLCTKLSLADLPSDWADDPPPLSTQLLGTTWVRHGDSAILAVPSAIVRVEAVFLINPRHPDFSRIRIGSAAEFHFNSRLLGRP